MKKTIKTIIYIALISTLSLQPIKVLAFDQNNFFGENDILFYDPTDSPEETICVEGFSSSGSISPIPQSSIDYLDGIGLRDKVEANKYRYLPASQATGVPWQAIAALHYRENAKMEPDKNMHNGTPLAKTGVTYSNATHDYVRNTRKDGTLRDGVNADGTTVGWYYNVDGKKIVVDPVEDATRATELLVAIAKSVYGVDVTSSNLSVADWGNAFLAYNRGSYYKMNNKPYTWSPYVMNGYNDSEYAYKMRWRETKTDMPNGKWGRPTGLDSNMGALTVLAYLGNIDISEDCETIGGGAVRNNIIATIKNFALNYETPVEVPNDSQFISKYVKPSYLDAFKKHSDNNPSFDNLTDCGRFVSVVMRATELDPNFPIVYVPTMQNYMTKHPEKYKVVGKASNLSTSDIKPGDIIAHPGHILFYTGGITDSKDGKTKAIAQASLGDHPPNIRSNNIAWVITASENYYVYRYSTN